MKTSHYTKSSYPVHVRGIFWFRQDLRLDDMPALEVMCQNVTELLLVYVRDSRMSETTPFGTQRTGAIREQFIAECLEELDDALVPLGQRLLILEGNPAVIIAELIKKYDVSWLGAHVNPGFYELQDWQHVVDACDGINTVYKEAGSLFNQSSLPFSLNEMPGQFTQFRKLAERNTIPELPLDPPVSYPPPFATEVQSVTAIHEKSKTSPLFRGGENAALERLNEYLFKHRHVLRYKETRNALDDETASTRFSPWLAAGALSPRRVYFELRRFEDEVAANESTYWVYFELLWREFFHFAQLRPGKKWYLQAGLRDEKRPCHYDADKIIRWQQGRTGYPIVDACMRQLTQTGFMSNRGRQLVASCLVHELGQNWQYGAAWFEQCLVDYDPGSNWGNWLYLGGVGHDPRGHRQFDLEKQTNMYDPERTFINKWLS